MDHPRVVQLLYCFQTPVHWVLVMEYTGPHGNLKEYTRKNRAPPFHLGLAAAQAARFTAQILEGLGHMHSRGLLHRDVKMENVMVDGQDRISAKAICTAAMWADLWSDVGQDRQGFSTRSPWSVR